MTDSPSPRERLVAMAAVLSGVLQDGVEASWKRGEDFVAALEADPDTPRQCPCCTKLVTLCISHYQLHEPGKPCVECKKEAGS